MPSSLKALGEEGKIEIFPDCTSLSDVEYLGTNPDSVTWFGNIFDNSMPNNLYLPYVEEPTDPTIKDKWNKFLGYSWSGKIRYKTPYACKLKQNNRELIIYIGSLFLYK